MSVAMPLVEIVPAVGHLRSVPLPVAQAADGPGSGGGGVVT